MKNKTSGTEFTTLNCAFVEMPKTSIKKACLNLLKKNGQIRQDRDNKIVNDFMRLENNKYAWLNTIINWLTCELVSFKHIDNYDQAKETLDKKVSASEGSTILVNGQVYPSCFGVIWDQVATELLFTINKTKSKYIFVSQSILCALLRKDYIDEGI